MHTDIKWVIKAFDALTTRELYRILQIRNEIFVVGQQILYCDVDDLDMEAIHLMGIIDDKMIAYCRIFGPGIIEPDACNFGRVGVIPSERGKGYGKSLIYQVQQYLGLRWPKLTTIIHAQHYLETYYADLGFQRCSGVYDIVSIPHIDMEWKHENQQYIN